MNLRVIIVILSLMVFIATALGGYFSYLSLVKSTLASAHLDAEDQTKEVADHIDSNIEENQKLVRLLAGYHALSEALIRKDRDDLLRANNVLDLFQKTLDASVCYLMDSKGNTIASSNRNNPASFVDKNYSFRPYFQEAMDGNPSVYMALGVTSKKRGLYVGHPIYGNDKDTPVGIAVIKTSINAITDVHTRSYDGIIVVTNRHGLIFISSNEKFLYKFLWQVSEDVKKEIAASKQFGKGPWDWTGIEIEAADPDHAIDKSGNSYHIHKEAIHRYNGWKAVYLHEHKAAARRISAPIFRTTRTVIIVLLLITVLFVIMLYKKASDELTARKKLAEKLRDMSITDELTGLYNRRGFFELARHEYHTATRSKSLINLFYLDIDDMKNINDGYGHSEGDNALKDIAEILKTTFRKSDILARLGGDEFAVLMVRTADYKSENISNRLENTINDHNCTEDRPFKLSMSIGEVTSDPEKQVDFDDFIQTADRLMYEQKNKKGIAQQ